MTSNRVFLVTPEGDNWRVSEEGDAPGEGRQFQRKDEAIEAAKKLAQGFGPSLLRVQTAGGAVELEQTFGKDPLVDQLQKTGFWGWPP